jgi:serine/threonine protein kinase
MRLACYLFLSLYLLVQGAAHFVDTTDSVGPLASAHLALATLAFVLAVGAIVLLMHERSHKREPSPAWPAARIAWCAFSLLLIVTRAIDAYQANQVLVGVASAIEAGRFVWSFAAAGTVALLFRAPPIAAVAPSATGGQTSAIGKYEIRGLLGRGAMGAVHEGWDPLIGRRVAIKTILLNGDATDGSSGSANGSRAGSGGLGTPARFRREAQAAGRLLHSNVVGVFDYIEEAGSAWLVMEFVDGQTLSGWLGNTPRPPFGAVLRVMDDILAGLGYCHANNVIHRDIKPSNIMLTREGRAKIADFGIARVDSSSLTQTGMVTGTAAYMSPEQFSGAPVDARSDLYSCGVMLYLMLTGERPYTGSGLTEIMYKVMTTEAPTASATAGVPTEFDAVVKRAMAKSPADRYQSAADFAAALRRIEIPDEEATTVVPRS